MATDSNIGSVIVNSIAGAFKNYPNKGDGTTWDDQIISLETSSHLAGVILADLDKAGFEIVKKK
jgi:hypothetical protein